MPGVDFDAVKHLVPLDRVLELIGWRPHTHEGRERRGACPVHRSRSPKSRSFAVNGEKWYCHACKTGGDQIRLYALVMQLDPYAAALELCRRQGLKVPWMPRAARKPRRPRNREEER